ncbi:MAG TPA: HU family DNA-binding protein [Alphaproteobacteria bacterium]|nr:HU family DNA-binding protein [Alphaproteobacteria bacterium]
MNTVDLAAHLADLHELPKSHAKAFLDDALAAILDAVSSGDEVSLAGFGKFTVKARPARKGRNPATGESIKIAATKRLTFSAAKAAKEIVNAPKRKRAKK